MRRPWQREKPSAVRHADRYLGLGAREARQLGQHYIGSDHVLLALASDRASAVARTLGRLGVSPEVIGEQIRGRPGSPPAGAIDPAALAALGIDLEAVRERIERSFGEGALEDTRTGCWRVEPCLKQVLARAVEHAAGAPLTDEHILLGMLSVPDSVAARLLAELDVSLEAAAAAVADRARE